MPPYVSSSTVVNVIAGRLTAVIPLVTFISTVDVPTMLRSVSSCEIATELPGVGPTRPSVPDPSIVTRTSSDHLLAASSHRSVEVTALDPRLVFAI